MKHFLCHFCDLITNHQVYILVFFYLFTVLEIIKEGRGQCTLIVLPYIFWLIC